MDFKDLTDKVKTHRRINDVLVDTQGFKTEVFIGIPGVGRFWLYDDGTYKSDIPNE